MVKFGADEILNATGEQGLTDEDIDLILQRGAFIDSYNIYYILFMGVCGCACPDQISRPPNAKQGRPRRRSSKLQQTPTDTPPSPPTKPKSTPKNKTKQIHYPVNRLTN